MAQTLVKTIADFNTTLALKVAVGATTATLTSATDDDGVILPTGTYIFTVDRKGSTKEYFQCTLTGTALTNITTVARGTSATTAGFARTHRKGAEVIISDFAAIKRITNVLDGTTDLDSGTPLKYDATATISNANHLATKAYADGLAIAGAPDSSTSTKGIGRVSVAPVSAAIPIFVGDNDGRVPTQAENDAMVGTGTPSSTDPYLNVSTVLGIISPYAGFIAPTGWLLCDGSAVSRVTYAGLFGLINPSLGTVTMTLASPAVVSLLSHGLVLDDIIYFTTTGALPTGVAINTRYYIISTGLTADAFQFSATKGGVAINSSVSQSGVHTLRRSPYGVGDGTTTFNIPNLKGSVIVGRDSTQTEFNTVGETGGAKTHTLDTTEIPSHSHTTTAFSPSGTGGNSPAWTTSNIAGTTAVTNSSTGGGGAHNNLQPYITLNYIIKA